MRIAASIETNVACVEVNEFHGVDGDDELLRQKVSDVEVGVSDVADDVNHDVHWDWKHLEDGLVLESSAEGAVRTKSKGFLLRKIVPLTLNDLE